MENPLSAREFLKRFHLPQLVRIAGLQQEEESAGKTQAFTSGRDISHREPASLKSQTISSSSSSASSFARTSSTFHHSKTGLSKPAHELSREWTFSRPAVDQAAPATCGSPKATDFHQYRATATYHQLSSWSSSHVDLLLARRATDLGVRMPRASLARPYTAAGAPAKAATLHHQTPVAKNSDVIRKSLCLEEEEEEKEAAEDEEAAQDRQEGLKHSTRLGPVSKRPMLSKLELNQPFLLYKAYKKLELCAYFLDPKNQLNEKSGDPIYFPHNYPGWFSVLKPPVDDTFSTEQWPGHSEAKPLESVEQICTSRAEFFLSRDEIIGYQLPSELTHLTKLQNNQLLALPLAVNLDNSTSNSSSSSSNNKWKQHLPEGSARTRKQQARKKRGSGDGSPAVCGLKQIVIKSGQVLKICGLYEDILPLIEGGRHPGAKPDNQSYRRLQDTLRMSLEAESVSLEQHYQMAQQAAMYQRHQQPHPHPQRQQAQHLHKEQLASGAQRHQYAATAGAPIYGDSYKGLGRWQVSGAGMHKEQPVASQQRLAGSTVAVAASAAGNRDQQLLYSEQQQQQQQQLLLHQQQLQPHHLQQQQQQQLRKPGQRYARCLLVSERALDKLTGCLSRGLEPADQNYQQHQKEQLACEQPSGEIEVLIPIEQRGRFYLCASRQSLARELSLLACTATSGQATSNHRPAPAQVFRLSQLVYLLNLSHRKQGTPDQLHKLPLHLHLVAGPRSASYSPSMFGHSSTMESYFRHEANVAGHSLTCRHNKNYAAPAPPLGQPADGQGCGCGLRLTGSAGDGYQYGSFSAVLRLESLVRRDALLACTIKRQPLAHLSLSEAGEPDGPTTGVVTSAAARLMMGLRERSHEPATAKKSASLSKSSFGRLRACRSLISLNGGRRKKRPKIPEALMMDCMGAGAGFGAGGCDGSATEGTARCPPTSNLAVGLDTGGAKPHQAADSIVLLELDCNEPRLELVRTFVDSSLPTSSIPDLVLNRMEFCHRNSAEWERQLKLSYATLAHDFDSCSGQLELNRRLLLLRGERPSGTCAHVLAGSGYHHNQYRHHHHLATTMAGLGAVAADNSSAGSSSSRSSSGVSSVECVGGPNRDAGTGGPGRRLASLSSLDSQRSCDEPTEAPPPTYQQHHQLGRHLPADAGHLKVASGNRLLRFVHRLLPGTTTTATATAAQSVASGRRAAAGSQPAPPPGASETSEAAAASDADGRRMCAAEVPTLMNAQRVYRKMLLAGEQERAQHVHQRRRRRHNIHNLSPAPPPQHNETHDDTASHLYESLDRLNLKQKHRDHCGQLLAAGGQRGPGMRGRSLDYLLADLSLQQGRHRPTDEQEEAAAADEQAAVGEEDEEEEEEEEEEVSEDNEEEDWWCQAGRRRHGVEAGSTGDHAHLDSEPEQLEPVSIEQEEVAQFSDEQQADDSFSSSRPEVDTDRSYEHDEATESGSSDEPGRAPGDECPYVNLIDVDGRQTRALSRQLLACTGSRAERKLVRMRARQPAAGESAAA